MYPIGVQGSFYCIADASGIAFSMLSNCNILGTLSVHRPKLYALYQHY